MSDCLQIFFTDYSVMKNFEILKFWNFENFGILKILKILESQKILVDSMLTQIHFIIINVKDINTPNYANMQFHKDPTK